MARSMDAKRPSFLNDLRARGLFYQALLVISIGVLFAGAAYNAVANMKARGIPMGFAFWNQVAGFEINLHLIDYSGASTYGRAFWVGVINTLMIAVISIPLATVLGFSIGVARLSSNWLLSRVAQLYTIVFRNTPLLLLLLFWYNAVLRSLPGPRESIKIRDIVFLNGRGLYLPKPILQSEAIWFVGAIAVACAAAVAFRAWALKRQDLTGERAPIGLVASVMIIGLPLIAAVIAGAPLKFDYAEFFGFNLKGGLQILPEMAALLAGLVTFTAAFIAEIVRAGVLAVSRGQTEAANALGLHRGLTTKLVVMPQAMRLIAPPLTSQYLNVVKNSSLAVFIGYPDLVQIFAGTVLNQTQAAVQVMAITMAVYLAISLAVSAAINAYSAHYALVER
jgi:general L-amino acid transport system permease protein